MSTFNLLVPPHLFAPLILQSIEWGQPGSTKYPLMGRMRYAWLSEDYKHVKIMLKDGPDSWSEEKEEIKKQIEGHEGFVSCTALERDPVYLIAEFKPQKNVLELLRDLTGLDVDFPDLEEKLKSTGHPSLTKDPFVIFDEGVKKMEAGDPEVMAKLKPVADMLKKAMDNPDQKGGVIRVGADGDVDVQTVEAFKEEIIEKKEEKLKNAIDKEDYEKAAQVRDDLKELKGS